MGFEKVLPTAHAGFLRLFWTKSSAREREREKEGQEILWVHEGLFMCRHHESHTLVLANP